MADIYRKGKIEEYVARTVARLSPEDRDSVERYLNDLGAEGYSIHRIMKIASNLTSVAERMGVPLTRATADDIKRWSAGLEGSEYSGWTKHDHRSILRKFMRWLGKGEAVAWLKVKPPKNGTLPEEVLTEEDVKKLVQAAYTARDRALILALYESGCRIGEFLPLRLKHLQFDKHGALLLIPEGKTGRRRVRLVASTLPLQRWLEEHPRKGDPESYLWCPIPAPNNPKWTNRHLNYDFLRHLLQELGKKAGVKKKANPHAFRHARATFMARHLKEPEMREFFGWGKDSDMPSIYVHLSGRDVDGSVLSIYGIKETERGRESELKTFECPRCREKNDSTRLYCGRCGLPFEEDIIKEERLESVLVDFIRLLSERVPQAEGIFKELAERHGLAGQPGLDKVNNGPMRGPERRVLRGVG